MKNFEKFIEVFGSKKYEEFLEMAQDNAPVLRWFLSDMEKPEVKKFEIRQPEVKMPETVKKEEILVEEKKKRKYTCKVRRVNYEWYVNTIEDFYLSGERSKTIKLKDDMSALKPAGCLATLRDRFVKAVRIAGLNDVIIVRKYYLGTVNECIALENTEVARCKVGTYKYD